MIPDRNQAKRMTLYCSFCGRSEREANRLISGPNWCFICDTCVLHAVGIIAEKRPAYRAEVIAELDEAAQREIAKACRATANRATVREGE